jgi:hypothetical protein
VSFRRPPKTRSRPQSEKGFNAPQRVMRISQCVRRLVLVEFFQDRASRSPNRGKATVVCRSRGKTGIASKTQWSRSYGSENARSSTARGNFFLSWLRCTGVARGSHEPRLPARASKGILSMGSQPAFRLLNVRKHGWSLRLSQFAWDPQLRRSRRHRNVLRLRS